MRACVRACVRACASELVREGGGKMAKEGLYLLKSSGILLKSFNLMVAREVVGKQILL